MNKIILAAIMILSMNIVSASTITYQFVNVITEDDRVITGEFIWDFTGDFTDGDGVATFTEFKIDNAFGVSSALNFEVDIQRGITVSNKLNVNNGFDLKLAFNVGESASFTGLTLFDLTTSTLDMFDMKRSFKSGGIMAINTVPIIPSIWLFLVSSLLLYRFKI